MGRDRRKLGRSTKAATARRWSRPLCSLASPCPACRSKREIRELVEKYLPARVDEIDWFGEGLKKEDGENGVG